MMTSIDIDESLREQSQLLLRKLKEKQSRLQNVVGGASQGQQPSHTPSQGEGDSCTGLSMRTLKERADVGNQAGSHTTSGTLVNECPDTSLKKTVPARSSKEGRSRLQRKRTQSRDKALPLRGQPLPGQNENKENLEQACTEKQLKNKHIHSAPTPEPCSMETNDNAEVLKKISDDLESDLVNGEDFNDNGMKSAGTPNTVRRRKIIDRNVKVSGATSLNVSELMQEVEEEFPRLNYSYSNVEDTDLKFLQDRLGSGAGESGAGGSRVGGAETAEPRSADDNVPVRDVGPESCETYSDNLENPGNSRKFAKYIRDAKKPRSILLSNSQRGNKSSVNGSRVSFRSPTRGDTSSSTTQQLDATSREHQRMLGYDWIAALLDNDPAGVNQSETFFDELKEFRKVNLEECVNQVYMTGAQELWEHPEREPLPVQKALEETKVKPYMVNERLFPQPIQRSLWPGGQDQGEPQLQQQQKEGTYEEPRFVRVSIPRSTLMPPTRVKPHRRNSFEAADSMALAQHCLKGCNTSKPSTMPAASNIGLRNATLGINSTLKTTLDDAETLAANYPYEWNPAEQSICRPLPRPAYRPETSYLDSSWPAHVSAAPSSFGHSSATLKQATDELLDSTYSLMYEMQKLKTQRSDHPLNL